MIRKSVLIGGASGAWGDSPLAIGQLLTEEVHYLMMDYLAEVTMSLLAKAKLKDSNAGFPPDFISYLKPHLKDISTRGIKVVTNAGGVNPLACKAALELICNDLSINLKIAVVIGDDVVNCYDQFKAENVTDIFSNTELPGELLTANAYLGALSIKEALTSGADIVITGRCADSALALGILMHEFRWDHQDFDLLASGSLVGHVLECGPQSTGGIFTDWESVPNWHNIGYPIARCFCDGTFELSKPRQTGGLISIGTVSEQILYEIENPSAYLLPDVTADFSSVNVKQIAENLVFVSGAKGYPPTSTFKVSATYQDGFRAVALISISGVNAYGKAERTANELLLRARNIFRINDLSDFSRVHIEILGAESSYPNSISAHKTREVILRLVVDHSNPKALNLFAKEIGSVGLSFAQGTTGLIGGRPKVTPVIKLFSFLLDKKRLLKVYIQVSSGPLTELLMPIPDSPYIIKSSFEVENMIESNVNQETDNNKKLVPLIELAFARSGDKGDKSNIAIISRDSGYWELLRKYLTPSVLKDHFQGVVNGQIVRYEVPGLSAFNFVLDNALAGGGMSSPRIDPQGKALGQRALEILIPIPNDFQFKG